MRGSANADYIREPPLGVRGGLFARPCLVKSCWDWYFIQLDWPLLGLEIFN